MKETLNAANIYLLGIKLPKYKYIDRFFIELTKTEQKFLSGGVGGGRGEIAGKAVGEKLFEFFFIEMAVSPIHY